MNLVFLDVLPDPVGASIVAIVLLMVIGFVILAAAGLVFFLWYRKRKLGTVEMIRADTAPIMAAAAQPNNPNQP